MSNEFLEGNSVPVEFSNHQEARSVSLVIRLTDGVGLFQKDKTNKLSCLVYDRL